MKNFNQTTLPSNKKFGLFFVLIFFLLGLFFFTSDNSNAYIFFSISLSLLIISFICPSIFKIPNFLWMKLGMTLGMIVSPIILSVLFFFVITPIGLLLKVFGKDVLLIKNKNENSFWIKRKVKPESMIEPF